MAKNPKATNTNPSGFTKAQQDEIKVVREAFAETRGHELRITDQSILDIVSKVEGWDDMEADEQLVLFDKAEEAFKDIAVTDPGISGLVSKMDEPFWKELDADIEAFIKAKNGTIDQYGSFKRIWTKEQFDAIPYPGSTKDSVVGNQKPDIVVRKNTTGPGEIRTVFLDDLIHATAKGKALQADIEDTRNALKVSGSVKRFPVGTFGTKRLKDLQSMATLQLNSMRKMWRGAIQLHHKLSAIEGMPLVKVSWIEDESGSALCPRIPKDFGGKETFAVTRSGKPFWIDPCKADGTIISGKGLPYSLAQVTAFDPDWAMKQPTGGTVNDLIESGKPDPVPAGETGKKMTTEELDLTIVTLHGKLSSREEMAAMRVRALSPGNDDLRESICYLYLNGLKATYEASKTWYDELLNGRAEPEKPSKVA